ncbi:alkyl/aryl-sulfatase [Methanospirillum stamsii]|uniref:MBL fold metallo-hydrolase n=1 Tax=Methanospirillum stamsii TaxID=1277351 RepID=A0A2V2MS61_9EURY|nr:alkyl sulfatase dimerization domain-containing protein [Methanospirillum stamsii]PWR70229.1 MBL fold metallo-hydrolase [Methanospirillum stamsii]
MKKRWVILVLFCLAFLCGIACADDRNDATDYTIAVNEELNDTPAWDNNDEDFDFANRGFMATDDPLIIPSDYPGVDSWNMSAYDFLENATCPNTINPLLYRQAQLNNINGLYNVTDGIYQVRGYDVTSMTLVKGDTGWIVVDPMVTVETARAAMDIVNQTIGDYPVKAVIYTHPHVDHYQGVKGVTTQEDVDAGRVEIIAPEHFMEHALSENVYAGNAMFRRATYQYGTQLPKDAKGNVDIGLGKTPAIGTISLIPPTLDITHTGQQVTVDGVDMEFHLTTNTEAPVELDIWFPQKNALLVAEDCTATYHNILTLRGAQVRDPLAWSNALKEVLELYGDKAEVMLSSHHWPRYGNDKVREILENQRDLYKYVNDQTLNLMNKGYTMDEIASMIEVPESLKEYWYTYGFYGQIYMGVKATYQKYLGFYDANPINLKRVPPEEYAQVLTEYMGGADAALKQLQIDYDAGEYELVASIAHYLVFADPTNMAAREIEAAALEQLGYQSVSGTARNAYLMAARDLRSSEPQKLLASGISDDIMSAMTMSQLLDYISVRVNGEKAKGQDFQINLILSDNGDQALLKVKNNVLVYYVDVTSSTADVTVRMPRKTLEQLALDPSVTPADVTTTGDAAVFDKFVNMLDVFDTSFNIVLP